MLCECNTTLDWIRPLISPLPPLLATLHCLSRSVYRINSVTLVTPSSTRVSNARSSRRRSALYCCPSLPPSRSTPAGSAPAVAATALRECILYHLFVFPSLPVKCAVLYVPLCGEGGGCRGKARWGGVRRGGTGW